MLFSMINYARLCQLKFLIRKTQNFFSNVSNMHFHLSRNAVNFIFSIMILILCQADLMWL
jgi:hypothetical protein